MKTCELLSQAIVFALLVVDPRLTVASYVINSEAAKKLYKTMKGRPTANSEPKDLGREWHSDCKFDQYRLLRELNIDGYIVFRYF